MRAGVCFPVILFGEVQGTMDFFTVQSISLSKGRLEALQLVSDLVSQSLSKLIESERSRRRNLELQNGIHDVLNVVESATRTMAQLDTSGSEIGGVIKVISNIAEQTNLLALNATIEAARAGTAGKGFAVVAQEVKTLAQETSRSTNDISVRVESIRDASRGAIHAIEQNRTGDEPDSGRSDRSENRTGRQAIEPQNGSDRESDDLILLGVMSPTGVPHIRRA